MRKPTPRSKVGGGWAITLGAFIVQTKLSVLIQQIYKAHLHHWHSRDTEVWLSCDTQEQFACYLKQKLRMVLWHQGFCLSLRLVWNDFNVWWCLFFPSFLPPLPWKDVEQKANGSPAGCKDSRKQENQMSMYSSRYPTRIELTHRALVFFGGTRFDDSVPTPGFLDASWLKCRHR